MSIGTKMEQVFTKLRWRNDVTRANQKESARRQENVKAPAGNGRNPGDRPRGTGMTWTAEQDREHGSGVYQFFMP